MDLLISSIANEIDEFNENGVKLLTIGDINSLPENCMLSIKDAVSRTSENSKLTLILAVNYSSKWEITQAVRTITIVKKATILLIRLSFIFKILGDEN
jgi:undecaprenyl diphosphate synthase